ncbi:uncharacterized protein LOC123194685 [Mangifera indica]|uniref:uncharacterized protein LOC123194685 n=1 Tax=Mangifera indica TaxID=29780 RepID=UPI001CFBBA44|nr:uncharacterized protein LOC123194685 [Mangifera indica]
MMPASTIEQHQEESSSNGVVSGRSGRFANLRGVQWRVNLGILPHSSSSSIDDLRRVTADSRRRYAGLRRSLLVDPHFPKDGSNSPDPVMDNPLSQNPDSTWGRFFRNAELEKMVDKDLSRLYPEHGSYFQTPGCQGILRRILLLWCLRHPEYGYRQGMHELLAPLLYVLHVDVDRLCQVRKEYEDHFTDKFDGLSFHENDLTYNFDFKKFIDSMEDDFGSCGNSAKVKSLDELDPEIQTIVLLSDAYGAEGELGIVLSEKFMEHDAYCMFDALMSGAHGLVSMADFFAPSLAGGPLSSLPPVIEASTALYYLLSIVDSSLHSHLVELGVEPQYFGLRWLRVLFGREFSLEALLIIWDEIFASDSGKLNKSVENDEDSSFKILSSPRGALIAAIAVSMMLYLRSSLLATENATSCLQRLLNFPENVDLGKIIDKAKSLQALVLYTNTSSSHSSSSRTYNLSKSAVARRPRLPSDSVSPSTPLSVVPDSYWEEKWRVLHNEEEKRQGSPGKQHPAKKRGWSERVRLSLSRTESDPSSAKVVNGKQDLKSTVRRSLLTDLSRELGLEGDNEKVHYCEVSTVKEKHSVEVEGQDGAIKDFTGTSDDTCVNGNVGCEENSSIFSDPASSVCGAHDNENDSEKSSVASNSSVYENDGHPQTVSDDPPLPVSHNPDDVCQDSQMGHDSTETSVKGPKERKLLFGKIPWVWKFGRNACGGEESSEKGGGAIETKNSANVEGYQNNAADSSDSEGSFKSSTSSRLDTVDQNVMGTLKNLGHSMLEQIQVIESVFQQDRGQVGPLENLSKNIIVGKGQATAMTALKELRKISNLLSEM